MPSLKSLVTIILGVVIFIIAQIILLQNEVAAQVYHKTGIDPGIAASAIIFLVAGYFLATDFMKTPKAGANRFLRLWWLILQEFKMRSFRNLTMMVGVGVVVGALFLSMLLTTGALYSVNLATGRLGSDIVVVPAGTVVQTQPFYTYPFAFSSYMNKEIETRIASINGVDKTTSQLFMAEIVAGAGCGVLDKVFLIGVNPEKDFMLNAWLKDRLNEPLKEGEVIKGASIPRLNLLPVLKEYGVPLTAKTTLDETGTYLDHVLYIPMETAQKMSKTGKTITLAKPLTFTSDQISTVFVKVKSDTSAGEVANKIRATIKGVTVIVTSDLAAAAGKRLTSLMSSFYLIGGLTSGVSVILISTVTSTAVNERRREIGLLRSLGASRFFVFKLVTAETVLVTLIGGIAGVMGAWLALYVNYVQILSALRIPFLCPAFLDTAALVGASLGIAMATGIAASLLPAFRSSSMDSYDAIREGSR